MSDSNNSYLKLIFLGVGLALLSGGLWGIFIQAPSLSKDAQLIKNAPELEVADVNIAAPGEVLVLTGDLGGIPGSGSDELVVYERQRWHDVPDDGSWERVDCFAPRFISIGDRRVPVDLAPGVDMGGDLHYERKEGSIRLVGYKNGDLITVFGAKRVDGRLVIERVHGGPREQLVKHLDLKILEWRWGGLILLLIGVLIALGTGKALLR